jgi:hypothetical protein
MGPISRDIEVQGDKGNLMAEISDQELEAAASSTTYAAMTFPSAPTVSVVVLCCGNDYPSENTPHKSTVQSDPIQCPDPAIFPQMSAVLATDET